MLICLGWLGAFWMSSWL